MNDRRTIVAFAIAFAFAIASCCPNGSPTGCAALSVPTVEVVTSEISIQTAETRNETRYNDPLGQAVVGAVNVARGLLADVEARFVRSVDRARRILAAIEAPFARPNNGPSNDHEYSGDGERRRRRSFTEPTDSWIDQLGQSVVSLENQLIDLSSELSDAPNFLKDLAASTSKAIAHPFEFAANLAGSAAESIGDATQNAAYNCLDLLWRFLTTQGLPWLHATLDELDRTIKLPPTVHTFVQNFDAVYSFAKLLGYVK